MYKQTSESLSSNYAKLQSANGWIEAGKNKKTLINALIGINDLNEYNDEIRKIEALSNLSEGPDIVSDLSTIKFPKNYAPLWKYILHETSFVAASVPVYTISQKEGEIIPNELLDTVIEQIEGGVGLITIHPTVTKELFMLAKNRLVPYTSRGGGIIIRDMIKKNWEGENAYISILPEIIVAAKKHKTVLSIGTTFRSANIFDAYDKAQRKEIKLQLEIAQKIKRQGIDVIIETPGHARPETIKKISRLLRGNNVPIMPLGPIPTDISIGMDHVSSAIGATLFGLEGCVQIISTVTREEHLGGKPTIDSTIEAVKTARIAAHIIDIHILKDDSADLKIAKLRAVKHSCIAEEINRKCERCGNKCPLKP